MSLVMKGWNLTMSGLRDGGNDRARRRTGIAVGVGAAAGGMLIAAMGQLAGAPVAHADDFSEIVADIQAVETVGQADFSDAASELQGGNYLDALAYDLAGADDLSAGPASIALVGGTEALEGDTVDPGSWDFTSSLVPATDTAGEYFTAATSAAEEGLEYLEAAGTELATSPVGAAEDLALGFDYLGALAPDYLLLGLGAGL